MRTICITALALLTSLGIYPQVHQDETSHKIEGGGISVPGWTGEVDAGEKASGKTVNDSKFAAEGTSFHITTGPATTYWNPASTAAGSYTVKATFTEPKYMSLNSHPHPYGIVIAGNDLGTAQQSYLYCAAYGSGTFIVRGFGPDPFQMNGRRGESNAAVHKASAPGESVTQEIAMSVKDGHVSCAINGTEVATYEKSAVVAAGKLKSTDGIYGLRLAHNTDVIVSNFSIEK